MVKENMTTAQLHDLLDRNKDDQVDKQEFVQGMHMLGIPGMMQKDYVKIFETIDIDGNAYLSANEFSLYLEGAQKKREQKISELPPELIRDMETQIRELFQLFDDDNSQTIDKNELIKTFTGLGYEMDEDKAMAMIKSVDTTGKGAISLPEFTSLMMPEMQNRLLEQDDRIEDFRAMFRAADTDYSGYLSADEVYTVLLKNGIDLTYDELVELIAEFDVSGDA